MESALILMLGLVDVVAGADLIGRSPLGHRDGIEGQETGFLCRIWGKKPGF
ncbi:hypothetical protein [Laspinema sp. D2d]|uniref:hypothetical protein n=1 Tax=Laspinema sp. D2d TaxID=2953686 RepID=UPI0021BADB9C|nr:hypothetical protein [Laspinema sp. D2d]